MTMTIEQAIAFTRRYCRRTEIMLLTDNQLAELFIQQAKLDSSSNGQ
jgi:hypothetical protein